MKYIKQFNALRVADVPLVGGKNASLGQMISALASRGVLIPDGFAVVSDAYWHVITANQLQEKIIAALADVTNADDLERIAQAGKRIRELFLSAVIPQDLLQELYQAYDVLSAVYHMQACDVAVRSSATAEDLPGASFAGQQDTFLNVRGYDALREAYRKSLASLFTDRAISYRMQKGFDHLKVALSVGVQKMVHADRACSGVAFSLDTESGFRDVVLINASYGLGESIVQGLVIPDEYCVSKVMLARGYASIIKKACGSKETAIVYSNDISGDATKTVSVDVAKRAAYALSDDEIVQLAQWVVIIESYYSELNGTWTPMDVEWAKDADDGRLYILQARPETVHAVHHDRRMRVYRLTATQAPHSICSGQSIGTQIVHGIARVVKDARDAHAVQKGDIVVTHMTDPDWVPALKRAAGIITDRGGRTCHAAIVSRELGVPAIVGARDATRAVKSGQIITIDCSGGMVGVVYDGEIPYTVDEITLDTSTTLPVSLMLNLADPDSAFAASFLPVSGVGLARVEFIIANHIRIHPLALVEHEQLDRETRDQIHELTVGYADGTTYFIQVLGRAIGMIAAAFYPRRVIVRLSDFKSNEYRNLIGGADFEPYEENPMIGLRGASRYINSRFASAFALECAAFTYAREVLGFDNITIMVPFVRTLHEARAVRDALAAHGISKEKGWHLIMMCEVPSNVILIKEFAQIFEGFSIGSNDLTQLTLGVDRDSELLQQSFDERDPAVTAMLTMAIAGAHEAQSPIGICGQAPSDYPEVAVFLIQSGIDYLSLNIDSVIPFYLRYARA